MAKVFTSVDELIGKTPLLKINTITKEHGAKALVLAKLESFNPIGSAKDRVAKNILDDAEKKGFLSKDTTIIEPTSGNTGVGLAALAAARGYKMVVVMPETMSKERQLLMKAFGAELILTEGAKGMRGAIEKAEELNESIPNSFIAGQFTNPANPEAHYLTTGPEIWEDTDGKVDIFISAIGTGGTISGVGKFLKEKNPDIRIIGVEPKSSCVLSGGTAGAHKIQGIGAGFIPDVLDTKIYDEIIPVTDEDAHTFGKELAKKEGVLAGISSGAAMCAAIKISKREENKDKTIVVLLPDTGERYLSSGLYE